VKEEAEGLHLTSAAKEGLHQVVPKANSQTKTFKTLNPPFLGGFFLPQISQIIFFDYLDCSLSDVLRL
jgi:hypothetical protein